MQRASKSVMTMCALLASWLGGAALARADAGGQGGGAPPVHPIGVVLIAGGAAERQRTIVAQAIEAAVRDAGWSPPPKPFTKTQSDAMLGCLDAKPPASCVPASPPIARVFVVTVENGQAENGEPMVVLTGKGILLDPPSTAIRQQHCERCASNDLTAASTELAKIVLRDLAVRAGTTIVELTSDPDGAEIVLDGQRIGATNGRFNTYPGKHVVRFEKPGYVAEAREFTAEEDKSVLVSVTLQSSEDGRPPIRPPPSKLVPGILLGTGGVLGVTGAVWIFYYGTKDGSGDRYRYTRTMPLGVGAAAVGVGAAGLGAYLLWKGSRSSAPTVSVTSGGAVLSWMGTFR